MHEFAATVANYSELGHGLIRIAFGNSGPYVDSEGHREPVFNCAITLPPYLALDLARMLLTTFAKPEAPPDLGAPAVPPSGG